jgi:hypothetical protein
MNYDQETILDGSPPAPTSASLVAAATTPSSSTAITVHEPPPPLSLSPIPYVPRLSSLPPVGHRSALSPLSSASSLPSSVVPVGSKLSSSRSITPTCSRHRASPRCGHASHVGAASSGRYAISDQAHPLPRPSTPALDAA